MEARADCDVGDHGCVSADRAQDADYAAVPGGDGGVRAAGDDDDEKCASASGCGLVEAAGGNERGARDRDAGDAGWGPGGETGAACFAARGAAAGDSGIVGGRGASVGECGAGDTGADRYGDAADSRSGGGSG